ncbi:DUF2197 domain-containing protein [Thermoactinomyces sp. DSM 45892]|uniref:DUF2197 domain-containing protein n=1 Tax=Thermoactinomyces sp. DSM 45892 TaxID=1882753 RepID=UPI0008981980|nr:DUF2197 domain-containing protein [Thermoactinomyces sp. DSM 45892]SDY61801.1 hypothetical protein SAMN05444416_106134 [Thermoactinomyces sp. DSM 45892]
MKIICILCEQRFEPDRRQKHKLRKHPHMIQICFDCHSRISEQVEEREKLLPPPERANTRVFSGKRNRSRWKSASNVLDSNLSAKRADSM